jgi:exonuclease III
MRISSYNILHPEYAIKWKQAEGISAYGESNWEHRKLRIINNIKNSNSDVICLQEISQSSLKSIQKSLSLIGYELAIFKNHPSGSDGVAIFYLCTQGVKLKNTDFANIEGRVHVIVDFEILLIQKVIRVATCHLFGAFSPKATEQMKDLCQLMEKSGKGIDVGGYVICGDFNKDDTALSNDDPVFKTLNNYGYKPSSEYEITENPSAKHPHGRRIDWIFAKSAPGTIHQLTHVSSNQDHTASDHRLIGREFMLSHIIPTHVLTKPISKSSPVALDSSLIPGPNASTNPPKRNGFFNALFTAIKKFFDSIAAFFRRLFS